MTAALLLAAAAALAVDVPIARLFRYWNTLPTIAANLGYIGLFEPFGHGLGVIVLLLALHQLDPARRWAIPRLVACAVGGGGLADLLKMLIVRIRPYECALDGAVWTTFGSWLPWIGGGSEGQSFPSAHTATAAGFAAGLIWLYPQGRLLFSLLAVLVGCQRIVCGAHYLSDVLVGAAAGCLAAQFILHVGCIPKWFDRWEQSWRRSPAPDK